MTTYNALKWENCRVRLGDLREWEHNPATIGKAEAERLLASLDEFGQVQALAIDPDNIIVDGHQRKAVWSMAERYGVDFIADCRRASRALTEKERQKLAVFLRSGAVGHYDWDELANWGNPDELIDWGLDKSLADSWVAGARWVNDMIDSTRPEADAEPQIDRAAELLEKWQVKTGDLWRIGEHRLLCGDSTKREDVERVMQGERADCAIIDPPYSSGGFQEAGKSVGSIGTRSNETIKADNLSTRGYRLLLLDALSNFKDIDNLYIFTDWRMWIECFDISERAGWKVRSMIVWDKEQMGMGMPWRSQHELILFGKQTSSKMLNGKCGNVLHAKRTGNENHPTEKPAELIQQLIGNTDGMLFVDFFAGSGTTLVACQNLGRRGRGIEISPAYCAVTLQRMQDAFPGIEIERIDG